VAITFFKYLNFPYTVVRRGIDDLFSGIESGIDNAYGFNAVGIRQCSFNLLIE